MKFGKTRKRRMISIVVVGTENGSERNPVSERMPTISETAMAPPIDIP